MPKTLEEALAKITELTTLNTTLQTDLGKAKTDLTTAAKAVKDKDTVIAQKNDDIVKLRQSSTDKITKLEDMSKEEREKLSEAEIELKKQTEALDTRLADFEKKQAEATKKEIDARIDRSVKALAGKDEALAAKIKANYERIGDSAKATTDEEVTKVAGEAFNMLGIPKPDAVRSGLNGGNGAADGGTGTDQQGFSESQAGKDLAAAMNLAPPPKPAADAGAAK